MSDKIELMPHNHQRLWKSQRYIYPVYSRRARGISIGVNLNVDKICNFGCVYCEVNRGITPITRTVNLLELESELKATLALVADGSISLDERFAVLAIPDQTLHVQDIAFSGDGEPTSFRNFDEVVARTIAIRDEFALQSLKIVLITNASLFHRATVQQTLLAIHSAGGEVWAKLDAGTNEYFHLVDRTAIKFERILTNLQQISRLMPIVIQTCFMRLNGVGPDKSEIMAYCKQLESIVAKGGQIKRVQIYTVARPPAERNVTSLDSDELKSICLVIREKFPQLSVERFDGNWDGYIE
jgi:wyosine [tRNA(Phe)-imidazoG37] synthetase (radical SAM superfamily)